MRSRAPDERAGVRAGGDGPRQGRRRARTRTGRWQTAAWDTWRHTDPETPAAPLVLPLPAIRSTTARLVVDEGDNRPLPIGTPAIQLRTYRLLFSRERADELWLVYGKAGLTAPRYDMALLDAQIRSSAARDVAAESRAADGLRSAKAGRGRCSGES